MTFFEEPFIGLKERLAMKQQSQNNAAVTEPAINNYGVQKIEMVYVNPFDLTHAVMKMGAGINPYKSR